MTKLRDICGQLKYRRSLFRDWDKLLGRKGLNVIFSGLDTTAKTAASEVVANELKIKLYKIDLAKAKDNSTIAEVKKRWERLFVDAESTGALLLLDKANVLFGRLSGLEESDARHADLQRRYLLRRMDNFRGMVVLATDNKDSLDPAFAGRI